MPIAHQHSITQTPQLFFPFFFNLFILQGEVLQRESAPAIIICLLYYTVVFPPPYQMQFVLQCIGNRNTHPDIHTCEGYCERNNKTALFFFPYCSLVAVSVVPLAFVPQEHCLLSVFSKKMAAIVKHRVDFFHRCSVNANTITKWTR